MKRFAVGLALLAAICPGVSATSRQEINFQGQLTYSNGDPIDSTVAITFDLFSASTGGTSLWTETHSSVTVADGVFDVVLGSTTPLTDALFATNTSLWVESTVGSTVISPRIKLTSVPWAFDAATLDGIDGGGYALAGHDHLNETWNNALGTFALKIQGGDQGFRASVDSTAFTGIGSTNGIDAIRGRNLISGTMGSLSSKDPGGLTRPSVNVGVYGTQIGAVRFGSLGTTREGVFGYDQATGVEGAVGCAAEPQLTAMGIPFAAGVYGTADGYNATGGEFYHPGGPSAPSTGDDIALIIGQGHLAAAGRNPGLNPTIPSPGMGPANVASIVLAGPVAWVPGASPVPGSVAASWAFVPDINATLTSLIWVFPSRVPYPGAVPGAAPAGRWYLESVGPTPVGPGFIVASTAAEGPADFVYWLVN
ncbi:MAG: hypothetical protein MUE60_10595 [Candidatus Eisenbacteria bacterium]|jgi:hypothetical protein|nr:hypothetical protein [Candidatus Eisenbacteria bacterium]